MARKSAYDFYLDKCLLPVAPQKLEIKINSANSTVTLINDGEINILKNAGLTDIEFECIIPQMQYSFAVYNGGFQRAEYFLDYFEQLKTSKEPFQFIVSRTLPSGEPLFSTNITVSLEDYTITEAATDGFDLTVKIKLKQYRDYGTKTVTIKQKTKAKKKKTRSTKKKAKKNNYKVGDIVTFKGGTHYYTSYKGAKGYPAKAGKAKITIANGAGKAHPWHLIHTDSKSNVYGWVDDGTFE